MYAVFLRDWMEVFPRDQFLFLETDETRHNPHMAMQKLMKFLDTRTYDTATNLTVPQSSLEVISESYARRFMSRTFCKLY